MIKSEVNKLNASFIREHITDLRLQKGVSEHRMSLDLGHACSYIHGITSGKVLPSMAEFLSICDYFEITPEYFFRNSSQGGVLLSKLESLLPNLSNKDLSILIELAERFSKSP